MKKEKTGRRSFSIVERYRYWFDNKMANGSLGFLRILITGSLFQGFIICGLILLFGVYGDSSPGSVVWDTFATLINGWFPFYEEGSIAYLILMAMTAIAGLMFTSVLIGIVASSIEEKMRNLRSGNSFVLEKNHIIVLGFYPGEYTLLRELILSSAGQPGCIVIAEDLERETMEQNIRENLDVPGNFRIVCRRADITDPSSLEKCSFETCRTVIVSPTEDMRTIKTILAVTVLLEKKGIPEVSINAIIANSKYRFPPSIAETNHITTLEINDMIAKIIAHTCTQTGLSEAFREVFRFEGSEFYLIDLRDSSGLSFQELIMRLNGGVPVGIYREGRIILKPPADCRLLKSDKLLVFSEERDSVKLEDPVSGQLTVPEALSDNAHKSTNTVIIGHNEALPVIIKELPENVSQVYLAGQNTSAEMQDELERLASERELRLDYYQGDLGSEKGLTELAGMAKHIVILNDHEQEPEEADTETIFLLLNLREIRKRFGLKFNITVEMQNEHDQMLVSRGDHTDFLVSSSMSALILAQLSENPELIDAFKEILSNDGNELLLKKVEKMHLEGTYTVRELRLSMLKQGYILLGDMDSEKHSTFNRSLDDKVTLTSEDKLIVLGEK